MNQKTLLFLLLLISTLARLSAEEINYNIYQARDRDNVEAIAKKFFHNHKREYGTHLEEYVSDIKFWNPHVKDWKKIPEATEIYISYPYPPYPAASLGIAKSTTELEFTDQYQNEKKYKLSTSITLSQGTFDEIVPTGAGKIQSQLNSPFSFGIGGMYFLNGSNSVIVSSAYISVLKMAQISGDTQLTAETTTIPNEIGANIYRQNLIKDFNFSIYEGLDYENFSTFNIKEYVEEGAALAINNNTLIMATLGVSKTFTLGEYNLTTRGSFAKVISSSSDSQSKKPFYGERLLFFINLRGNEKYSYNFLYKKHTLRGPTNLTVTRIGLGLSYELF